MHSATADILVKANLVDELQLRSALAQQATWGGRLGKHVVELGFASEGQVAEALAKASGLERVELDAFPKDPAALAKVDIRLAEEKAVFPYALRNNGKTLFLAMAEPTDLETVDLVSAHAGGRIRVAVAGEREISAAIYRHYRGQEPPPNLVGENRAAVAMARISSSEEMELVAPVEKAAPHPAPKKTGPPARSGASAPVTTSAMGLRVDIPADVAAGLSPAALEYLRRMKADLEKTSRILRGLVELLVEKKLLTNEEIRAAITKIHSR